MTDVTPANASFPSKISPTKPEEAGRSSPSSGHSGSEARRNQNAVKNPGGEEHTQPNGTRAAHTPGGKQSGVRKVNRERDLKVKEMGTCPPFLEGGGDTWLCANEGGRQKWLYRSPEFSKGDSRRRVRLLLAVLAGDLVPDRLWKVARAETTQMCGGGGVDVMVDR